MAGGGGGPGGRVHVVSRGFAVVIGIAFVGVGGGLGHLLGFRGLMVVPIALATGMVAGAIVFFTSQGIARGSAAAIGAFIAPTGRTTPYQPTYSRADALAAAGNYVGAMREYDDYLVAFPDDIALHIQAAELHARHGTVERAASLFQGARRIAESRHDRARELYATQRLADLYLGRGGAPGRALVELRRIAERYPNTPEASGARLAIARLKPSGDDAR